MLDLLFPTLFSGPLHPMLVHLPVAFALFAPVAAGLGLALARGPREKSAWGWVVLFHLLLCAVTYAAMAAGEHDADRLRDSIAAQVEHKRPAWLPDIVAESLKQFLPGAERHPQLGARIEEHEEAAERFFLAGLGALLLAALAWKPTSVSRYLRWLTLAVEFVLLALMIQTADLGGDLIYRYGAADYWVDINGAESEMPPE